MIYDTDKLALFDFDGTITYKDSLATFIRFAVGDFQYLLGLLRLSPMLIAYKVGLVPNDIAKQNMFSWFFKGMHEGRFKNLANEYALNQIDKILRPKAIEKLNWHKQKNHQIIIVSASIECWLKPWCDKNGYELLATRLEISYGKLTGKFATKNCYGIEKVNRVINAYDLDQYDYIYAYGDSKGDKELLALADESFYKPFRNYSLT